MLNHCANTKHSIVSNGFKTLWKGCQAGPPVSHRPTAFHAFPQVCARGGVLTRRIFCYLAKKSIKLLQMFATLVKKFTPLKPDIGPKGWRIVRERNDNVQVSAKSNQIRGRSAGSNRQGLCLQQVAEIFSLDNIGRHATME